MRCSKLIPRVSQSHGQAQRAEIPQPRNGLGIKRPPNPSGLKDHDTLPLQGKTISGRRQSQGVALG